MPSWVCFLITVTSMFQHVEVPSKETKLKAFCGTPSCPDDGCQVASFNITDSREMIEYDGKDIWKDVRRCTEIKDCESDYVYIYKMVLCDFLLWFDVIWCTGSYRIVYGCVRIVMRFLKIILSASNKLGSRQVWNIATLCTAGCGSERDSRLIAS